MKTNPGRYFEDYRLGETIVHATPRTIGDGERAIYQALYPNRHALYSSEDFARASGFSAIPLDNLLVFHTVFGKTVPDISLNAVANLGYAEGRFLAPVQPGATLSASSEVIGLKEISSGKAGIVYVRTTGRVSDGTPVLSYVRWVMVRKRDPGATAPDPSVPELAAAVDASDLVVPDALDFSTYDFSLAGEPHRWGDYEVGERIDHVDRVTVEEAEHMMATRLWQNTAKVHFDATHRDDGRRLIYGGHIISLARALSFNGLANAQMVVALNGGSHANPCFSGMTVTAWSEVLDKAEADRPRVGALRLRLVAQSADAPPMSLKNADGKYADGVLLDLDYWAVAPL
ncbi:MAG: MaoC family dehydratase [Pseudomonadota bacterium]